MVTAAFVLDAFAATASWAMNEMVGVLGAALFGIAMTIILCGDFTRFSAQAPGGFSISAERGGPPSAADAEGEFEVGDG